ncbi:MAG: Uncharacterised protein [Cyanobium sp. ARS6]|nr:MAG: Uncharacterised protein [Cyanobium sp. ARS6]
MLSADIRSITTFNLILSVAMPISFVSTRSGRYLFWSIVKYLLMMDLSGRWMKGVQSFCLQSRITATRPHTSAVNVDKPVVVVR